MHRQAYVLKSIRDIAERVGLVGHGPALAVTGLAITICAVEGAHESGAPDPVDDEHGPTVDLLTEKSFDCAQARIEIVGRRGHAVEPAALDQIERGLLVVSALRSPGGIAYDEHRLRKVALGPEFGQQVQLELVLEPHVLSDHLSEHEKAAAMVALANQRARVSSKVLPDDERVTVYRFDALGGDVETVLEALAKHGGAAGVFAVFRVHIAAHPVHVVAAGEALIVQAPLCDTARVVERELERLFGLCQPVQVLGIGVEPAGLLENLTVGWDENF